MQQDTTTQRPIPPQPETLPRILVVKMGGGQTIDTEAIFDDLVNVVANDVRVVLVHGGNHALSDLQQRLGQPPLFVDGPNGATSRYTDADAIELMAMTYAGSRNVAHVAALRRRGIDAIGITGVDGGLLTATRRPVLRGRVDGRRRVLRDDHVGTLTGVNTRLLNALLEMGHVPVVTLPVYADHAVDAQGHPLPDAAGVPVNVDGDTAAQMIATALGAGALVYLSDVDGLRADLADPDSTLRHVGTEAQWQTALEAGRGRMRRKVQGAREAVDSGIGTVTIAAGHGPYPLLCALAGGGTTFTMPDGPRQPAASDNDDTDPRLEVVA